MVNFVWSIFINPKPAPDNPWNSLGPRVADADAGARGSTSSASRSCSRPVPLRRARRRARGGPGPDRGCRGAPAGPVIPTSSAPASRATAIRAPDPMTDRGHATTVEDQPSEASPAQRDARGDRVRAARRTRGRCGRAAGCSSASGPSPSPRWPSPTSTCARPTTRTCGARTGITAPTAAGAAIFAFTVACALLAASSATAASGAGSPRLGGRGLDRRARRAVAVGLQVWQLTQLPFFPGSSGYASCFIGWASMNIALVLSGIYWLETLLARELRLRRAARGRGHGPSDAAGGPPVPGQPRGLHVLLGLHRAGRHVLLGTVLRAVSREGDRMIWSHRCRRDPGAHLRHPARVSSRGAPLGLLPAPSDAVTTGGRPRRRRTTVSVRRREVCLVAALVGLAAFLPPVAAWPTAIELGQVLRYGLWAMVVPTLVVVGAPWRHRAAVGADDAWRTGRPAPSRTVAVGGLRAGYGLRSCGGSSPARRSASHGPPLARHCSKAVTLLIAGGIGLWLELVGPPPLLPRSGPCASRARDGLAMWLVWIEAYWSAMSTPWLPELSARGRAASVPPRDQQVASVILWFDRHRGFVPGHLRGRHAVAARRAGPRRRAPPRSSVNSDAAPRAIIERGGPPSALRDGARGAQPVGGVRPGGRSGPAQTGCRGPVRPGPPRPVPLRRSAGARSSAWSRLARAGRRPVDHEGLDGLDGLEGIGGGPQHRGGDQVSHVLAGGRPGDLDVGRGRRWPALVNEQAFWSSRSREADSARLAAVRSCGRLLTPDRQRFVHGQRAGSQVGVELGEHAFLARDVGRP